jgi:sugar phosphate isomerase/epimerase
MTLPYSDYSLRRALKGIANSGFQYVALGTRHVDESGERVPVLDLDAPTAKAAELGRKCRDSGLTPVMMFSSFRPEIDGAVEAHTKRIRQAEAAGIGQILTMGHTGGGRYEHWIKNLKQLGPIARDHGVMIVVKQHGGETATGEATVRIIREVDDEGIGLNYDAGNVLDYINVDPLKDIRTCAGEIRSFCVKDHRNYPQDRDCGPGFGEIDQYRLLEPVIHMGIDMPMAFENIWAPLLPRPKNPEGIDALAQRAREYLETVIKGLQAV